MPEEIDCETKPEIALKQIEAALKAGLPRGVALMGAGYGANTELRKSISGLALVYVAGIFPHTSVRAAAGTTYVSQGTRSWSAEMRLAHD